MRFLPFRGWPAGAVVIGALALGLGGVQAARAAPASGSFDVTPVACSASALSAAISGAASGATLGLAPSCTYTLTSALPDIDETITILGNNDKIQRAGFAADFSIFTVEFDGDLTLTALTLTGGNNDEGGAIDNEGGTVHVIGSYLTGNRATGDEGGGAIYSGDVGAGSVTVFDSTLTLNAATDGNGGAISSDGTLTLVDNSFNGNFASGDGGAIYTDTTVVVGNEGRLHGTSDIVATASVISEAPLDATASVVGGSIYGNSASGDGGGIATSGGLTVRNAEILSNHAGDEGGGVYASEPGSTTISGSQLISNSARNGGGGIFQDGDVVSLFSTYVNSNFPDNCEPTGSIAGCYF